MDNTQFNRVPVLTIGGFLGSGKTTLVNHVLQYANGRRIVVFVNDFGALNIDYDLVKTVESDRISLENGCVCCSLNDDLIKKISEFVKQEQAPDAIVIESSGVADPRALDSSLNILEESGLIRLDSRLYIIDAANYDQFEFEDAESILDNAAVSDIVLLNKVDLLADDKIHKLHDVVISAAPFSTVIDTQHCDLAIDLVFDFNRIPNGRLKNRKVINNYVNHSERYCSYSYETKQLVDKEKFSAFVKTLPESCLRAKAILKFSDQPDRHQLFNLVGYRASFESKETFDHVLSSQFVAIGLTDKMNVIEIEKAFLKTLSPLK